jgi:hypothetical protein
MASMIRTGVAELPLHYGHVPFWLLNRMKKLSSEILTIIIDEYGSEELLRRISNPHWFQAYGCVIGHDFHSSGITTTVCAVLKSVTKPEEHGLAIAGGKGKFSRKTPDEIEKISDVFNLSTKESEVLKYSSKMSAKVDNTVIQCGYPLYQHTFFVTEKNEWAVVQQGLNTEDKSARRYHWLSDHVKCFVEEPHDAIVGDKFKENVLDMTAKESESCRKISTDLVKDGMNKIKKDFLSLRPHYQKELREFFGQKSKELFVDTLKMPRKVNWKALEKAYNFQPKNYEELISVQGIGPSTVRGLALVSGIIYGEPPSWKDPCKFSFAYGGKDGIPHPIDRKAMDESISFLRNLLEQSKLEKKEKLNALKRLRNIIPE